MLRTAEKCTAPSYSPVRYD